MVNLRLTARQVATLFYAINEADESEAALLDAYTHYGEVIDKAVARRIAARRKRLSDLKLVIKQAKGRGNV